MMKYYFDDYGWLTSDAVPGRSTEVAPPMSYPAGHLPNWSGLEWVVAPYTAPVQTLEELKRARQEAVNNIKVTTQAGYTYDGDEVSINRMTAAITVLRATGGTVPWVLADNSVATVTADELTEALALSAAEVARLWVQPYV